ncbi:beta-galactosidase [Mucilaginibacter mallensis]|uniref:Beta-galactosidase n=1 Tax=Mucilaginibacter mallensis TaxID=652787 RepID=A0A1H1SMN1_MUCMA|nr:glycoside hydrolase family 2 TIM barrel-domain containing protein [Mucilaginibacter mallensis]SDS48976.1 beta-galactosidase [Mucilaginibacter mallensis]
MKKYPFYFLLIISSILQAKAQTNLPSVKSFNTDWAFVKDIDTVNCGQILSNAQTANINWEKVSLPHTPNIEPVNKIKEQWQGTCFYRKFFTIPAESNGKHIAIQFDAAMHEADIYLNGKHIYKHLGGFLPFYIDISNTVKTGQQNCILVKLNNQDNPVIPPGKAIKDLDFNYYGGIYRNAWLITTNKLYINNAVQANRIAGGGILIHDEGVSAASAKVIVKTDVNNDYKQGKKAWIKATLFTKDGKVVATSTSAQQLIKAGNYGTFTQTLTITNPQLWSPAQPNLYNIKIQVYQNTKQVDETSLKTGIKTVVFAANGFYINGTKLTIVGTNRHQEYPYIGYALSDNAQYRDAWKIKNAGFNFVRCSHYPPSPAFLNACDELGIMVMDAIPGWQFFGNSEFQKNSFQNIRDMIHRDRNHAAIVLWEASLNETNMSKDYMDTANKIVHTELPFKNVFSSGWMDYAFDVFNPARQHLKAPDYFKKYNHSKPLLLAEYGDWEYYAQNAGFNQKEYAGLKSEERSSRQLRTDGQQRMLQQALNFQESHNDNLYGPGVGDANWLMFDYKRGYAEDLETSGIMDIFRLPKFSFYFYQSQYQSNTDANRFGKPMVFIANYWNDPKQKTVKVFSNCDEVELFLNDKSLGIQKPDTDLFSRNLPHAPFTFNPAAYIPGKLTAIGYIKGKKVAVNTIATPGSAFKINIKADLSGKNLAAGKNDIIFIYASITDSKGTVIPNAGDMIKFSVKGNGELIGKQSINAEAGIATILLKAGDKHGPIKIEASSGKLISAELVYVTK